MKPIDLSLLFSHRDSQSRIPAVAVAAVRSAADRIIMPLDLRSSIAATSRYEPTRPR